MHEEVPFTHYADVNPKRGLERGREYPFVEMAALPEGGGELRRIGTRTFDGQGSRFAVGDTLFARITPCTENGKTSIVRDLNGSRVGFGSTEFIVLAAREESDAEFVHQVAVAPTVRAAAVSRMLGTSGRQRVPTWFFEDELRLPKFNHAEQVLIGRTLRSIDRAIERTEDVIAATENVRKALLQDLLTRGIPGWHSEWQTVPGIGTIPACWEVVKLGEVLSKVQYGTNLSLIDEPVGLPVLRMGNLQDGRIDWSSLKYSGDSGDDLSELLVQPGDLLFNRTNSIDLVGKVSLVGSEPPQASFASYIVRLQAQRHCADPYWLNALLNTSDAQERIRRMATKGASQANVNPTNLQSLTIPLPLLREQEAMVSAVRACEERENEDRQLVTRLRAIKRETASALLSGRVRVPSTEVS